MDPTNINPHRLSAEVQRVVDTMSTAESEYEPDYYLGMPRLFAKLRDQVLENDRSPRAIKAFLENALAAAGFMGGQDKNYNVKLQGSFLAAMVAVQKIGTSYDRDILDKAEMTYYGILDSIENFFDDLDDKPEYLKLLEDADDDECENKKEQIDPTERKQYRILMKYKLLAECGGHAARLLSCEHPIGQRIWQRCAADFNTLKAKSVEQANLPFFAETLINFASPLTQKSEANLLAGTIFYELISDMGRAAWPILLVCSRLTKELPQDNLVGTLARNRFLSTFKFYVKGYNVNRNIKVNIDQILAHLKNPTIGGIHGLDLYVEARKLLDANNMRSISSGFVSGRSSLLTSTTPPLPLRPQPQLDDSLRPDDVALN